MLPAVAGFPVRLAVVQGGQPEFPGQGGGVGVGDELEVVDAGRLRGRRAVGSVMSNGSNTHSTFRPERNGSTEYTFPSTETVAVLRTCRITLQENASFSSAGSGSAGSPPAASRAAGAWPVSECGRAW